MISRQSMKQRMYRWIRGLAFALGIIIVGGLAGCERVRQAPPDARPPLRVGAYYWPGLYWIDIAHAKGWFREAGLNVERVDTNADYFASLDQLAQGKLDIVGFTLFDFLRYSAKGHDLVAYLATDYSIGAEALVARPGIARVRELAGKRLGLAAGTYLEYLWTTVSEREGLKPDAISIVDIAPEQAALQLNQGAVDAVLTWEPFAGQALAAVQGSRLFDSAKVPGATWSIVASRRQTLKERNAELAVLTRVWQRTNEYLTRYPEEAFATVAAVNKKTPEEVRAFASLVHRLDLRANAVAFGYAPGFESLHGAARRMDDFMLERNLTARRIDTNRVFETQLIRDLELGVQGR